MWLPQYGLYGYYRRVRYCPDRRQSVQYLRADGGLRGHSLSDSPAVRSGWPATGDDSGGLILIAMAYARLGRFIEYIPESVTLGFTGGIAIVIATLQLKDFVRSVAPGTAGALC